MLTVVNEIYIFPDLQVWRSVVMRLIKSRILFNVPQAWWIKKGHCLAGQKKSTISMDPGLINKDLFLILHNLSF